jgi:hypothetical protein
VRAKRERSVMRRRVGEQLGKSAASREQELSRSLVPGHGTEGYASSTLAARPAPVNERGD